MSLGLCCQWLEPRKKRDGTIVYENNIDEKSLQLGAYKNGKYTRERIIDTYRNNVDEHLRILPKILEGGIKSFRLSSSLFPLFEFCAELARNDQQLLQGLASLGRLFKESGIRVTTHPGQFTVLSSDKQQVVENSIKELEYHAWIFDQMGLDHSPYYAINIHGGKAKRSEQLIDVINSLPDNVKLRLTLENDEKCYSISDLVQIASRCNIPVVFDSHHHNFNNGGLEPIDAFNLAISTWGEIKSLQHLSNTEPGRENSSFNDKRAHSEMIHYVPDFQLKAIQEDRIDVDIEAKLKNLAIFKMRRDFNVEV